MEVVLTLTHIIDDVASSRSIIQIALSEAIGVASTGIRLALTFVVKIQNGASIGIPITFEHVVIRCEATDSFLLFAPSAPESTTSIIATHKASSH